ncbi:hypothetical protein BDV93DRAFT_209682 [Ceratobasidium sp. AG-I]|nr:hypothetical protein BDV93DRAFT_209682 [Ceratobasidium sp. AG-I]
MSMAPEAEQIAKSVIERLKSNDELDEEAILSLHYVFQNTFLAALDLIDRGKVVQFTHQGRTTFQVHGTDEVYNIYLNMPDMCDLTTPEQPSNAGIDELNWDVPSAWCSCAPFAAAVLISKEQLMCKHLLAVTLSVKLNKLTARPRNNREIELAFLEDDQNH